MNTVRKLMQENLEEVKAVLGRAYASIAAFQKDRQDPRLESDLWDNLLSAADLLARFKPHLPQYKRLYFDVLQAARENGLSSRDLIMTFDRAVFELHTRLERDAGERNALGPWSPLMKEILDGRREIAGKRPAGRSEEVAGAGAPPLPVGSESGATEFLASGMTVFPGRVWGPCRVMTSDFGRVRKGDILVAGMTRPDVILAIDKVAGIVTEQGGTSCHAAVLAREFHVPCVVGCGSFLSNLKDEDRLFLDATSGILLKA